MGWVDQLSNQSIGLDTAPLIYFIEENPTYLPVLEPFFQAFDEGQFQIFTSSVTLLEMLMFPLKHGRVDLATRYEQIFTGKPQFNCYRCNSIRSQNSRTNKSNLQSPYTRCYSNSYGRNIRLFNIFD